MARLHFAPLCLNLDQPLAEAQNLTLPHEVVQLVLVVVLLDVVLLDVVLLDVVV